MYRQLPVYTERCKLNLFSLRVNAVLEVFHFVSVLIKEGFSRAEAATRDEHASK